MTQPVVHMMVGIPGSGKSRFARTLADALGVPLIEPDAIRAGLIAATGAVEESAGFAPSVEPTVWARAHATLWNASYDGSVVWDCTNVRAVNRAKVYDIAKHRNAQIIAWRFVTPFSVCSARNLARDRVVPPHVMGRMSRDFDVECTVPTLLAEGVDLVVDVNP